MDKEFQKLFDKLCYGRTPHSVWDDFIYTIASSIANAFEFKQEREDRHLAITKKYKSEELELFAQLFARIIFSLEKDPNQDYLGQLFMEFKFGNVRAGQYFTPYSVAAMMADITMTETACSESQRYETVNDPACGSGVMLIAAYNKMISLKRNPTTELFLVGQDIDCSIALMCYIQLSLLGATGYVVVRNSLAAPMTGDPLFAPDGAWCTPMYYHWVWAWRRTIRQLEKLEGK